MFRSEETRCIAESRAALACSPPSSARGAHCGPVCGLWVPQAGSHGELRHLPGISFWFIELGSVFLTTGSDALPLLGNFFCGRVKTGFARTQASASLSVGSSAPSRPIYPFSKLKTTPTCGRIPWVRPSWSFSSSNLSGEAKIEGGGCRDVSGSVAWYLPCLSLVHAIEH